MPAHSANRVSAVTTDASAATLSQRSRRHLRVDDDVRRPPPDQRPALIDRPIVPRADSKLAVALAPRAPP